MEKKINVIMHMPDSEDAKEELQRKVACVHADAVISFIKRQNISLEDKSKLLDAVIKRSEEQE